MVLFERAFMSAAALNVLGVRVDPVSMREAVGRILSWALSMPAEPRMVFTTGVHGVMEGRRDPLFRSILNRAHLNLPDGMPLAWIGRAAGCRGMTRVFGPDLMLAVCAATRETGVGHFLCGGKPGVVEHLAESLRNRYPGLNIAGVHTPPMSPLTNEDRQTIAGLWKRSAARILWLGVSTPKQECWAVDLLPLIHEGVIITVGAAFDYNTGRIRRAPPAIQQAGLEWAFRLAQEPRRLFPRYLSNNPRFAVMVLLQAAGLFRPRVEREDPR